MRKHLAEELTDSGTEVTATMKPDNRHQTIGLTFLLALMFLPHTCAAQDGAQSLTVTDKPCPAEVGAQGVEGVVLSPRVMETARIIGVDRDLTRLSELTCVRSAHHTGLSLEELELREEITNAIISASLDVDSAMEEIRYEQGLIAEMIGVSRIRRDRALGTANLAVLTVSTGLGIIGSAFQLSSTTSDVGDALGFASGGISTLFSVKGLQQSKEKSHIERVLPNMLAAIISAQPEVAHRLYPEVVWAYLNSVAAGETIHTSRREQLVASWLSDGRLLSPSSPHSAQRISLLTTTQASEKKLDLPILTQRIAMLGDVQHAVAHMKYDLADLLKSLRRVYYAQHAEDSGATRSPAGQ